MIAHKIEQVIDDLCIMCSQCWEHECRAFQVSHSNEESTQREIGNLLCQVSALRWAYAIGHSERLKEEEVVEPDVNDEIQSTFEPGGSSSLYQY